MRVAVLSLLFLVLFCAGAGSQPWEPNWRVAPINLQLANLTLPRVSFHDADLVGALRYLQHKAEGQARGAVKVSFALDLPADFKPRYELSLDAASIPFGEALRYLGEQGGLQFSQVGEVIYVRREGTEPSPLPLATGNAPGGRPSMTPLPYNPQGLAGKPLKLGATVDGALGKPAEATGGGNNTYRNTSGEVQPDKSGFVPKRELNGFPEPKKGADVNCARPGGCPAKGCGCNICPCVMH